MFRTTLKSTKQQERQKKTRCTCCWGHGKSKVAQQFQKCKKIVAHSIAASACCSSFKCHLAKTQAWCKWGEGEVEHHLCKRWHLMVQPLQSSHATAASCHRAARGGVGGCHWHETVQFHPEQTRRAAHSGTSMQHEKSTKVLAHPVH